MDDTIGQKKFSEVVNTEVVDQSNNKPVDEDGYQKKEEVIRAVWSNMVHREQGCADEKGKS